MENDWYSLFPIPHSPFPNGDKLKGGAFCQLPDMVFGAKKTLYMELDFGQKNLYSSFSILHSPFSIPLTTTILP